MRFKRLFSRLVILSLIVFSHKPVFAATTEEEIAELKARISALEQKLAQQEERIGKQQGRRGDNLEKIKGVFDGLSIGVRATFVMQGTHNANGDALSKNGEDVADASYSLDLTFLKKFEDYGQAFVHLEQGNGAVVEDELKVFSNVNRDVDSDNNVRATEVWYEHYFKTLPLKLMVGKIDGTVLVDTNEYANDECTQFLGRMIRNSPTIELPDNSAGVRANIAPTEFAEFDALLMDADGDWEDIGNDIFSAIQINFKPKLLDRPGNYRFYGWINTIDHTKWNDSSKTQEKGYGFGISFDQELTDNLGAFLRYGWQNPKVYLNTAPDFSLEQSYSLGVQLKGNRWGRKNDIVAVAFGQIFPSGDYKKAGAELDPVRRAKAENHLECCYNYKANDHLSLSPDLQVIWNPYGCDATNGNSTIIVGCLRVQVDF